MYTVLRSMPGTDVCRYYYWTPLSLEKEVQSDKAQKDQLNS